MIVYKYYPLNKNTIDALKKGYFFFSKVAKLNDPFDSSFNLINRTNLARKLIERKVIPPMSDMIMANYGTCSFSEVNDSMHMWAFYANNFDGLVIGYDDTTFETITESLLARVLYYRIAYLDNMVDVDNPDMIFEVDDLIRGKKSIHINECFQGDLKKDDDFFAYLLTIKSKSTWQEEREHRLIAANDIIKQKDKLIDLGVEYVDNGYKIPIPNNAVKQIIIGHNVHEDKYDCIKDIIKKYNISDIKKTVAEVPFNINLEEFQI